MEKDRIILKVPAIIEKVMTMADNGLRLFVDTQELGPADKGLVMALHKKIGHFVFAEQDLKEADIKELPEIRLEKGEKSPSMRLRGVLYVYWEQQKITESFEIFYRRQLERFINTIKEKLN